MLLLFFIFLWGFFIVEGQEFSGQREKFRKQEQRLKREFLFQTKIFIQNCEVCFVFFTSFAVFIDFFAFFIKEFEKRTSLTSKGLQHAITNIV